MATCFLQVTGDSIFNLLSLADVETDKDDRPVYPQKILSVEVSILNCHILYLFQNYGSYFVWVIYNLPYSLSITCQCQLIYPSGCFFLFL